jgi:hypothetical protein
MEFRAGSIQDLILLMVKSKKSFLLKAIIIKIFIIFLFNSKSVHSLEFNEENLNLIEKIRIEASIINSKSSDIKNLTNFKWGNSAKEMEENFLNNKSFVWCGDAAYYLMQKYSELGIESYILSVGLEELDNKKSFTHALVLVALDHKNTKKYILQDSYLNWGSREDYFSILDKLKNNELKKINFQINENNYKKFALNDLTDKILYRYNINKATCDLITNDNKNYYVCLGNENLNTFIERYEGKDLQDTLYYAYNNLQRTNNESPFDILTLPYAIAGKNGYIDIKIVKDPKKYNKFKNLTETKLLIKIINYNK